MLGPSNSGKTTILYRLRDHKCIMAMSTLYTNTESILINGMTLEIWDITNLRNEQAMRPHNLWRYYLQHSQGVIYVVDSTEQGQSLTEEARSKLWGFLNNENFRDHTPKMPLLVYANKQDQDHAMIVAEVRDMLELGSIPSGRPWHIQGVCAVTGQGLQEGMDWLTAQLMAN